MTKKIYILGTGSIGKRHLKNLIGLGHKDIKVYDPDLDNLEKLKQEFDFEIVTDYESGLDDCDAVIIATPNHIHAKNIKDAMGKKLDIFVEKPICINSSDLDEQELKDYPKTFFTGYNLLFNPVIVQIKKILDEKSIGNIYNAQIEMGSYLPSWRPNMDYRKNYGANKSMGGGILLDDVHELNYAKFLFGPMKSIFCQCSKISDLEMDVEDHADIILQTNFNIYVHMDYLQQPPSRKIKISGSKGVIVGDLLSKTVITKIVDKNGIKSDEKKLTFDDNDVYVDELKNFFECIEKGTKPIYSAVDALGDIKLVNKAKESNKTNKVVLL